MTGIYHRVLLATEQTSEKKGICSLTGRDDELELDKLPNPKLPELNATLGASVVSSTSFFGRCISVPFYAFLATLEFLGFGVAMTGVASRLARALLEASDPACVCQLDLAHFDTQIWPPYWTNNSSFSYFFLFSVASAGAEPSAAAFAARLGEA